MATVLDKEIIRESTVMIDKRNIIIGLTENQEITFKLKGLKSGEISIKIEDLYRQLTGMDNTKQDKKTAPTVFDHTERDKKPGDDLKISLGDLRSMNLITLAPLEQKVQLEGLITKVIEQNKLNKKATKF